jgi:hypothetical protein
MDINLNLKIMWYNRIVRDNDMNIVEEERIFIENGSGNEEFGIDVLGNSVCMWWD